MLVAAGGLYVYPDMVDMALIQSGGTSFTFDGAADLIAVVFHIPATGTISNVHYRVSGASSIVGTLRVELRTVDPATGLPNAAGTLYGSSTSITVANPTTGNKTAAVNCTGATAGDLVALVLDLSAYTSGNFTTTRRMGAAPLGLTFSFPYEVTNTSGSSSLTALGMNTFALEYGSHVYYQLEANCIVSAGSSGTTVSNSGVTRRGNRFTCPLSMRAVGMYAGASPAGDCFLRLRLVSDDSLLATATIDKDVRFGAGHFFVFFDAKATVNLAANTNYYVLMEGNSATNATIYQIQVVENQQLDEIAGGHTCYGTSYSGSYTDVTTDRYAIGVLFDQVDNGSQAAIGAAG